MRVAIVALCLLCFVTVTANAQVEVRRHGAENPMVTIAKSILWGGIAGLALGAATALIVDENQEEYIRWFFVGGVFVGLGVGIYHVATRPEPTGALIQTDGDKLAFNPQAFKLRRVRGGEPELRLSLFAYDF